MLLLICGTATAQTVAPDVLGYRVAMLSAASEPAYPENISDTVMQASRGFGGVAQQYVPTRAGAPFPPSPVDARVGYELTRFDVFDVAVDVPAGDDLASYDAIIVYNDVPFVSA
ncbi:MAG: hypothetical protein AAF211_10815, partial [Myxococcota bacterium]